ncbi:MAG: TonB-dependent receptor [Siphonobacter sp.]
MLIAVFYLRFIHLYFISIASFCLLTAGAYAQHGSIKGQITNSVGEAVEMVSIKVQGTVIGTLSDRNGVYLLKKVTAGKHNLQISRVGMGAIIVRVEVKANETTSLAVVLNEKDRSLDEVVVTGQFEPQSVKQSVFQIRTIDLARIQARSATSLTGILNTELGIRFTNDNTLGTTDIQLMGMTGRSVKILLDGVPMLDRGDTRESLNQIDINSIERIEIVEGPMSVSYGSDALAGVINIITKKNFDAQLSVMARVQEETAGDEYSAASGKGVHNQSVNVNWQKKGWIVGAGGTRNNFGGWQGTSTTRTPDWLPKDQLLANGTVGYFGDRFNLRYRLDGLHEVILSEGVVNTNTQQASDKKYITNRVMHQLQSGWKASERLGVNAIAGYTDYSRRTQTTILDLATGKRTLSTGTGEQDISSFQSFVFRGTAQYKVSETVNLQPGIEVNHDRASGDRIQGTPVINDFAFFVSSEIKPASWINIRPGLRFLKNSVYDAPPVIPAVNTKFSLSKKLDLRLAYARGFRSPALRELYFTFFDASHSIIGNPDLKAEYSNSFTGSFVWQAIQKKGLHASSTLGFFYNDFKDLISYGVDADNPSVTTYINIDRFKTTGGTLNNVVNWGNMQASLGMSYIGRYNDLSSSDTELPEFVWSPEVNANLSYSLNKIGTKLNLFYKYTGKRPSYETSTGTDGTTTIHLAETAAYQWVDFTFSKSLLKSLTLNGGVKNIFGVTSLANTSTDAGSAHSTGGPVPLSYGRSYFLGVTFNWSKK